MITNGSLLGPDVARAVIEAGLDAINISLDAAGKETFEVGANDLGILLALLLRRQRERQGLSLAEAAERLGQRSRNAYARYEQGKAMPTVEKLAQLLTAIAPDQRIVWRLAS